jgi:hypothetical protein
MSGSVYCNCDRERIVAPQAHAHESNIQKDRLGFQTLGVAAESRVGNREEGGALGLKDLACMICM